MNLIKPLHFTEISSFGIPVVSAAYYKMNDCFNKNEYEQCINYARTMIESTCKYIFQIIEGYSIEQVHGKGHNKDYISLNDISKYTLESLNHELSDASNIGYISKDLQDLINKIGDIRNCTSISHGSGKKRNSITPAESKFVIFMSESMVIFLLELLFNKTHSLKENAVGSVVTPKDFKRYNVGDDYIRYVENRGDVEISYETFADTAVIYMVTIQIPGSDSSDVELFTDHTRDYMEDDAELLKEKGPQSYVYRSDNKDFEYEVEYNGDTIYITKLDN
ncbi:abortive infection family protein [Companilactobacillus farciminis]|uniref:abortive infection family protein n=1 Tax=Companilactobacillus farciminis TaxID=1612 RepID=UPI00232EF851|nr:abortive infection family protein [Companilactobacillus farciminis]WCG34928.1 abortive infection family protein [Companilactobacillus farciminis]